MDNTYVYDFTPAVHWAIYTSSDKDKAIDEFSFLTYEDGMEVCTMMNTSKKDKTYTLLDIGE